MSAPTVAHTTRHVVGRVTASLLGGWAFVSGFVSLGVVVLVAFGIDFHDAETTLRLLAFLVLLFVFCWAFAASSLKRVWVVLAGGAVFMTATAWLWQRALV